MTPTVQTVTGPVTIEDIELADAHDHVWIHPPEGVTGDARIELDDYALIRQELTVFRAAGGSLIVDCQPGGAGRDARMLRRLSEETGVWITATTGAHQRKYYPAGDWLWSATVESAAQRFIDELTVCTWEARNADEGSTPALRAAIIKIGYEGVIEGQTEVLMEAAAVASRATGASILFHTEQGRNIEALPPFFARHGVPPTRLYMCHVDKRPDLGLHREMAQAGVLLGYDTFGRPKYDPDNGVWKLIPALAAEGLAHGMAVCQDFAFPSQWRSYGGEPGLAFLATDIVPRLAAIGLDASTIRRLTAHNVAERLAWQPY
ncbi:MAG: hypothetical protein IPK19_00800 [Chloroflexi bacterium]|nr:hypothetical protein [Chloroflexota bacterium]